jgi:hypothetical protein
LLGPSGCAAHRPLNHWDRVLTGGLADGHRGLPDDPAGQVRDGCGDAVLLGVDADHVSETAVDVIELCMWPSGSARRPGEDHQAVGQKPGQQLAGRRLRKPGELDEL